MRRGIGVGYVQETAKVENKMNELGSRITAERVSDIADQLEALERQLRVLSQRHKKAIQEDPVVRARFRQLADSLGLDLLSSQKNIFSGALGLGDFYYRLAGKVVECCMNERKFCGSYVPLKRVVMQVEKNFDGLLSSEDGSSRTHISEDDVVVALKKLTVLGDGYNIVELGGTKYIQTTPDGVKGTDVHMLLNYLVEQQALAARKAAVRTTSSSSPGSTTHADAVSTGPLFGAAYVLGAMEYASIPVDQKLMTQAVSYGLHDITSALHWEDHRASAALSRLVQDGTLWVDHPSQDLTSSRDEKGKQRAVPLTTLEIKKKGTFGSSSKKTEELDGGAVYWFFPQ